MMILAKVGIKIMKNTPFLTMYFSIKLMLFFLLKVKAWMKFTRRLT